MLPLIQPELRDPEFLSELQYTYTSPTELENKRGLLFINVKDKCFCVKPGPWIEERVWQKKREIAFPLCHECGTKKEVYYAMRNRVSDICIPRLRSTTETLLWDRPWSGYNLLVLFIYLRRQTWKTRQGWRLNQRCHWELEQHSGNIQRCIPIQRS